MFKLDRSTVIAMLASAIFVLFGVALAQAAIGDQNLSNSAMYRGTANWGTQVCIARTAPLFGQPECTIWQDITPVQTSFHVDADRLDNVTTPAAPVATPAPIATPAPVAAPARRDVAQYRSNPWTSRRQVCLYKVLPTTADTYVCGRWADVPGIVR